MTDEKRPHSGCRELSDLVPLSWEMHLATEIIFDKDNFRFSRHQREAQNLMLSNR